MGRQRQQLGRTVPDGFYQTMNDQVRRQDHCGRNVGRVQRRQGFLGAEPAHLGALRPDLYRHLQFLAQGYFHRDQTIPFLLVETWNEYEAASEHGHSFLRFRRVGESSASSAAILPAAPTIKCWKYAAQAEYAFGERKKNGAADGPPATAAKDRQFMRP